MLFLRKNNLYINTILYKFPLKDFITS